jgi:hypothetical protein
MKPKSGGNGSGKFEIGHQDMGGWVRVCAGRVNLPDDLAMYLSQTLSEWFRQRPQLRMRCVVPVNRDGNTVELHAWYDAHVFPPLLGPNPEGQAKADS